MKPIAVSPSKPVEGTSLVYGADQPEYLPLPAWRRDHRVITRWRLSWRERIAAVLGRSLYMEVMTFGQPIQPILPTFSEAVVLYDADPE